jgi:hypothetical protein
VQTWSLPFSAVRFRMSDEARVITGAHMVVDGGATSSVG